MLTVILFSLTLTVVLVACPLLWAKSWSFLSARELVTECFAWGLADVCGADKGRMLAVRLTDALWPVPQLAMVPAQYDAEYPVLANALVTEVEIDGAFQSIVAVPVVETGEAPVLYARRGSRYVAVPLTCDLTEQLYARVSKGKRHTYSPVMTYPMAA